MFLHLQGTVYMLPLTPESMNCKQCFRTLQTYFILMPIESLVKIGQYYRELAYGGYGLTQYRQDNAAMFDAYEQEYTDSSHCSCVVGCDVHFCSHRD